MGENLSVVDGGITYNFTTVGSTATGSFNGSASYYYSDNSTSGNGAKLVLDLYTGATQGLSGYAGGPLCSDTFSCGGTVETNFTPPNIVVTGPDSVGFTPPAGPSPINLGSGLASPEPSSALLIVAGGSPLLALRRRKRSA
jgi:hypothetical protein